MKKYIVIKEINDGVDPRHEIQYTFFTLFFAVRKATKIGKELGKIFHTHDRVFIKKGKAFYNPNKQWNEWFGTSWVKEPWEYENKKKRG